MSRVSLVIVLVSLAGCGGGGTRPETALVSGSVKFKGQPVDGAQVSFVSAGSSRTAVGVTDAEGAFKLSTFDTDDGAIPGEHSVTISKAAKPGSGTQVESPEDYMKHMQAKGGKSGAPPGSGEADKTLPAKYANAVESGLKRTVVLGEANIFNFDLTE